MSIRILPATFIIIFLSTSIQAQIHRGAILVSGSFNFNRTDFDSEQVNSTVISKNSGSFTNLKASPGAGFFVTTKDIIGARLTYDFRFSKNEGLVEMRRNEQVFSFGPFYSRYVQIGKSLFLRNTLNTDFGLGSVTNKRNGSISSEGEILELGIAISTGINYFLNERFALSTGIGVLSYEWAKTTSASATSDSESIDRSSRFGLDANFNSFTLGIQYFLNNILEE